MEQSINLHIDELVLHGFAPGDRRRIGVAVESELTRMFSEQGIPPGFTGGIALPAIDAGSFQAAPHMKAEAIGQQVAQSVYAGFNSGR